MWRNTRNYVDRKRKSVSGNITDRDGRILEHLAAFGVLADHQIQALEFASNQDDQQLKSRMSLLFHQGYVNRLNRDGYVRYGCNVYWLTAKGQGEITTHALAPNRANHPVWGMLDKLIQLNDLILMLMSACSQSRDLSLVTWEKGQHYLQQSSDSIFDLYFHLSWQGHDGEPPKNSRLLLVYDTALYPDNQFDLRVVVPGLAYVRSSAYRERYGSNSGRFLVITQTIERALFLKSKIEQGASGDAGIWFVTAREYISTQTFLHEAIWLHGGSDGYEALFV